MRKTFTVGSETLAGRIIGPVAPQILTLHGAGKSSKERVRPLAEAVAKQTGQSIFTFDFSGHGESTGTLSQSSLQKRAAEANAAWQFLATDKPITVMGFSMGGHIALELLKDHAIQNLVLFYPGIYAHEAFTMPFDERFSNIIRQPGSWQNATVLDNLKAFKGKLLIVWGDHDASIPRVIIDAIYESATQAQSRELFVVPGGSHQLLVELNSNPQQMSEVAQKVVGIINP